MNDIFQTILEDIGGPLRRMDARQIDALVDVIVTAKRVVLYGCGREGLQMRGLAMRLYHACLDVGVIGEMNCPPVGPGDLFFASSGPGELSTVLALMGQARKAGARIAIVTAEANGSAARQADIVVTIPAQTMASDMTGASSSILPMGSVFEGALFVLFELVVHKVLAARGVTFEALRARHTNLE
jgi:6-phospho-3-hexuloisomerase